MNRARWINREIAAYDAYVVNAYQQYLEIVSLQRKGGNQSISPSAHRRMFAEYPRDEDNRERDLALLREGMEKWIPREGKVPDSVWETNLGGWGAIARLRFNPPEAPGEIVPETVDVLVVTLNEKSETCLLMGERRDVRQELRIARAEIEDYQGSLGPIGGILDAPWIGENAGTGPDTVQSAMVVELGEEGGIKGVRTAPMHGFSTPGVHFLPVTATIFDPRRAGRTSSKHRSTIFIPKPKTGTILPPIGTDLDDLKRLHLVPPKDIRALLDDPRTLKIKGYDDPFVMFNDHGTSTPQLAATFCRLARSACRMGRETFDGQLDIAVRDIQPLEQAVREQTYLAPTRADPNIVANRDGLGVASVDLSFGNRE